MAKQQDHAQAAGLKGDEAKRYNAWREALDEATRQLSKQREDGTWPNAEEISPQYDFVGAFQAGRRPNKAAEELVAGKSFVSSSTRLASAANEAAAQDEERKKLQAEAYAARDAERAAAEAPVKKAEKTEKAKS